MSKITVDNLRQGFEQLKNDPNLPSDVRHLLSDPKFQKQIFDGTVGRDPAFLLSPPQKQQKEEDRFFGKKPKQPTKTAADHLKEGNVGAAMGRIGTNFSTSMDNASVGGLAVNAVTDPIIDAIYGKGTSAKQRQDHQPEKGFDEGALEHYGSVMGQVAGDMTSLILGGRGATGLAKGALGLGSRLPAVQKGTQAIANSPLGQAAKNLGGKHLFGKAAAPTVGQAAKTMAKGTVQGAGAFALTESLRNPLSDIHAAKTLEQTIQLNQQRIAEYQQKLKQATAEKDKLIKEGASKKRIDYYVANILMPLQGGIKELSDDNAKWSQEIAKLRSPGNLVGRAGEGAWQGAYMGGMAGILGGAAEAGTAAALARNAATSQGINLLNNVAKKRPTGAAAVADKAGKAVSKATGQVIQKGLPQFVGSIGDAVGETAAQHTLTPMTPAQMGQNIIDETLVWGSMRAAHGGLGLANKALSKLNETNSPAARAAASMADVDALVNQVAENMGVGPDAAREAAIREHERAARGEAAPGHPKPLALPQAGGTMHGQTAMAKPWEPLPMPGVGERFSQYDNPNQTGGLTAPSPVQAEFHRSPVIDFYNSVLGVAGRDNPDAIQAEVARIFEATNAGQAVHHGLDLSQINPREAENMLDSLWNHAEEIRQQQAFQASEYNFGAPSIPMPEEASGLTLDQVRERGLSVADLDWDAESQVYRPKAKKSPLTQQQIADKAKAGSTKTAMSYTTPDPAGLGAVLGKRNVAELGTMPNNFGKWVKQATMDELEDAVRSPEAWQAQPDRMNAVYKELVDRWRPMAAADPDAWVEAVLANISDIYATNPAAADAYMEEARKFRYASEVDHTTMKGNPFKKRLEAMSNDELQNELAGVSPEQIARQKDWFWAVARELNARANGKRKVEGHQTARRNLDQKAAQKAQNLTDAELRQASQWTGGLSQTNPRLARALDDEKRKLDQAEQQLGTIPKKRAFEDALSGMSREELDNELENVGPHQKKYQRAIEREIRAREAAIKQGRNDAEPQGREVANHETFRQPKGREVSGHETFKRPQDRQVAGFSTLVRRKRERDELAAMNDQQFAIYEAEVMDPPDGSTPDAEKVAAVEAERRRRNGEEDANAKPTIYRDERKVKEHGTFPRKRTTAAELQPRVEAAPNVEATVETKPEKKAPFNVLPVEADKRPDLPLGSDKDYNEVKTAVGEQIRLFNKGKRPDLQDRIEDNLHRIAWYEKFGPLKAKWTKEGGLKGYFRPDGLRYVGGVAGREPAPKADKPEDSREARRAAARQAALDEKAEQEGKKGVFGKRTTLEAGTDISVEGARNLLKGFEKKSLENLLETLDPNTAQGREKLKLVKEELARREQAETKEAARREFDEAASELKDVLRELTDRNRMNANVPMDPRLYVALLKTGHAAIKLGAVEFKAWSDQVLGALKEYTAEVTPFLRATHNTVSQVGENFNAERMRAYLESAIDVYNDGHQTGRVFEKGMIDELGEDVADVIRPHLKPILDGLKEMPGLKHTAKRHFPSPNNPVVVVADVIDTLERHETVKANLKTYADKKSVSDNQAGWQEYRNQVNQDLDYARQSAHKARSEADRQAWTQEIDTAKHMLKVIDEQLQRFDKPGAGEGGHTLSLDEYREQTSIGRDPWKIGHIDLEEVSAKTLWLRDMETLKSIAEALRAKKSGNKQQIAEDIMRVLDLRRELGAHTVESLKELPNAELDAILDRGKLYKGGNKHAKASGLMGWYKGSIEHQRNTLTKLAHQTLVLRALDKGLDVPLKALKPHAKAVLDSHPDLIENYPELKERSEAEIIAEQEADRRRRLEEGEDLPPWSHPDLTQRLLTEPQAEIITWYKRHDRDAELAKATQRNTIERALRNGQTVSPEVLKDYPDLAPKAEKPKKGEKTRLFLAGARESYAEVDGHNLLFSFADSTQVEFMKKLLRGDLPDKDVPEIVLDSGAFTIWKQGGPKLDKHHREVMAKRGWTEKQMQNAVQLERYMALLERLHNRQAYEDGLNKARFIALDVIPGEYESRDQTTPEQIEEAMRLTLENYETLRKHNFGWPEAPKHIDIVPVYHEGEDASVLERYVANGHEVIALGGTSLRGKPALKEWVQGILEKYPGQKFHGLGMTQDWAADVGLYSVDSTSWLSEQKNSKDGDPADRRARGVDKHAERFPADREVADHTTQRRNIKQRIAEVNGFLDEIDSEIAQLEDLQGSRFADEYDGDVLEGLRDERKKYLDELRDLKGQGRFDFADSAPQAERTVFLPHEDDRLVEEHDTVSRRREPITGHDTLKREKGRKVEGFSTLLRKKRERDANDKPETSTPHGKVADKVLDRLSKGQAITWQELFAWADEAFGGTQAQNAYSVKDAYDALELGVNKFLASRPYWFNMGTTTTAKMAADTVSDLKKIMGFLPTQSKRTEEMDEYQQFSTPPTYAAVVNWVASISKNDTVLEPSAGVGGLAVFAKLAGATVHVNELHPRRADLLEQLGFEGVTRENGEHLHSILPKDLQPSVIVMNPPFSSTAGRVQGERDSMNGAKHVEQALKRLAPGGRLVMIVGQGMADDAPAFRQWWKAIKGEYNVRANIGVDGSGYAKYGTTFDNQIIVIDKTGPTTGDTLTTKVQDVSEALALLEGIRNDRAESQPATPGKTRQGTPDGREAKDRPGPTRDPATDGVGPAADSVQDSPEGGSSGDDRGPESSGTKAGSGVRRGGGGGGGGRPKGSQGSKPAGRGQDAPGGDGSEDASVGPLEVQAVNNKAEPSADANSVFEAYHPQKLSIPGSQPHPGNLVQSAAMATVEPPAPTYSPSLPRDLIEKGKLSLAQLESIVYAGMAHAQMLADGIRKGFFIGDGTGVGKGREIAGILLDNWNQGRKKAVWISKNDKLFTDAKRDMAAIWGTDKHLSKHGGTSPKDKIKLKEGVIFSTYGTLRTGRVTVTGADGKAYQSFIRAQQIADWLGRDYDGVIVFDEAHEMANAVESQGARGTKGASLQAQAGIELQKLLPNARIVYVSATGATEVSNLAYAGRLGLWGKGTAFTSREAFIEQVAAGGLAAMELVARDMKALGSYLARSLSFHDVEYDNLVHDLTPSQREDYNLMARAWQTVFANMNEAIKETKAEKGSAAWSQFWGQHQNFFQQVIISMQMPSVIKSIEKEIEAGNSIVIQLVNTNETMAKRAAEKAERQAIEDDTEVDYEALDMTPKDILMRFVESSFPTQEWEEYTRDDGTTGRRPVVDSAGNPVHNEKALEMKEELLTSLGALRVPDPPLEMLLDHFGVDKVAEITGRTKRYVYLEDPKTGQMKKQEQKWSKAKALADARDYMDDRKQILVFSKAGGTGQSYHASLDAKNQRKRVHYILQAGWRADDAVQGFGRSHRTNQASAPRYVLVTTDLKAQKRFISSIARRLDQLGALTKGERRSSSQMFSATDNLENEYAELALRDTLIDISAGRVEGVTRESFMIQAGMSSLDDTTIKQFLNRLLNFEVEAMNAVFETFNANLEIRIKRAMDEGTYDKGLENVTALKIEKLQEKVVYTDPSGAETKYVELALTDPTPIVKWHDLMRLYTVDGFVRNKRSGKIYGVSQMAPYTDREGKIVDRFRRMGTNDTDYKDASDIRNTDKYEPIDEKAAKELWDAEVAATPEFTTKKAHFITGAVLPIWDRLPSRYAKVQRVITEDGERFLGFVIPERQLKATLQNLGAGTSATSLTPQQAHDAVIQDGSVLRLANGWQVARRKVSGEQRMEVTGFSSSDLAALKSYGLFTERINFDTRAFVPVGNTAVMETFLKYHPVAEVTGGSSGGSSTAYHSNPFLDPAYLGKSFQTTKTLIGGVVHAAVKTARAKGLVGYHDGEGFRVALEAGGKAMGFVLKTLEGLKRAMLGLGKVLGDWQLPAAAIPMSTHQKAIAVINAILKDEEGSSQLLKMGGTLFQKVKERVSEAGPAAWENLKRMGAFPEIVKLNAEVKKLGFANLGAARKAIITKDPKATYLPKPLRDTLMDERFADAIQHAHADAAIESHYQRGKDVTILPDDWKAQLKERVMDAFKVHWKLDTPFLREAREWLRQGLHITDAASKLATERIQAVLGELMDDRAAYDLFNRYVHFRDLEEDRKRGMEVFPDKLKADEVEKAWKHYEREAKKDQRVMAAVKRHDRMIEEIQQELVRREKLDKADLRAHYLPHKVIDFLDKRSDLTKKAAQLQRAGRRYLQARHGTERTIVTDYIERMTHHVGMVERDNMVDDLIDSIAERYDLRQRNPEGFTLPKNKDGSISIKQLAANPPKGYRAVSFTPNAPRGGKQYVVPTELADALEGYKGMFQIEGIPLVKPVTQLFKRFVITLQSPLGYNLRNAIGDAERVVTYFGKEPFDYVGKAVEDLRVLWEADKTSDEYKEALERIRDAEKRAVINSGHFMNEVGRIRDMREFRKLNRRFNDRLERLAGNLADAGNAGSVAGKVGKGAGAVGREGAELVGDLGARYQELFSWTSTGRENLLRLALYYANVEKMNVSEDGKTATMKEGAELLNAGVQVEGLSDPRDAAAKIARDVLGDYGNLTPFEQSYLRDAAFPFYSWMKVNTNAYVNLLADTIMHEGKFAGMKILTRDTAMLVARMALVYALPVIWNTVVTGEEEEELPPWVQDSWHVNLGFKWGFGPRKGEWAYLAAPSALDDFWATLGFKGAGKDIAKVFSGEIDWLAFMAGRGQKLLTSAGPSGQVPLAAMGVKTFPEVRNIPPEDRMREMLKASGLTALPGVGPALGGQGMSLGGLVEPGFLYNGILKTSAPYFPYEAIQMDIARTLKEFNRVTGRAEGVSDGEAQKRLSDGARKGEVKRLQSEAAKMMKRVDALLARQATMEPKVELPLKPHVEGSFVSVAKALATAYAIQDQSAGTPAASFEKGFDRLAAQIEKLQFPDESKKARLRGRLLMKYKSQYRAVLKGRIVDDKLKDHEE